MNDYCITMRDGEMQISSADEISKRERKRAKIVIDFKAIDDYAAVVFFCELLQQLTKRAKEKVAGD